MWHFLRSVSYRYVHLINLMTLDESAFSIIFTVMFPWFKGVFF